MCTAPDARGRGAAHILFSSLSPEGKAALDAYTAGVNSYLNNDPELPIEFSLLKHSPEPWQPADSLVWAKLMALDLAANADEELRRAAYHLEADLSFDRISQIDPPYDVERYPTSTCKLTFTR